MTTTLNIVFCVATSNSNHLGSFTKSLLTPRRSSFRANPARFPIVDHVLDAGTGQELNIRCSFGRISRIGKYAGPEDFMVDSPKRLFDRLHRPLPAGPMVKETHSRHNEHGRVARDEYRCAGICSSCRTAHRFRRAHRSPDRVEISGRASRLEAGLLPKRAWLSRGPRAVVDRRP